MKTSPAAARMFAAVKGYGLQLVFTFASAFIAPAPVEAAPTPAAVEAPAVEAENVVIVELAPRKHKPTDKIAMTYAQYEFLRDLGADFSEFTSKTQAMSHITKFAASEAIDLAKAGVKIKFA